MRFVLLSSVLCLLGCSGSHTREDDASFARPDAALVDAGTLRIDAGMPSGLDAGPRDVALGRALTCELEPDGAIRAAARFVACDPAADMATVVAIVEAWEAGLLSQLEDSGGLVHGLGAAYGCEHWRCAAEASDCAAYAACVELGRREGPCAPGVASCDSATLVRCNFEGTESRELLDCASFGATCADGRCALGACTFGADFYHLECIDDALTLCDGAIRMECDAWSEGSACASFYIGGEVPTQWCSPSGTSQAGAYSRPVECDGRTIRFVSVSTREHALDCIAAGYSGCDDRGCRI